MAKKKKSKLRDFANSIGDAVRGEAPPVPAGQVDPATIEYWRQTYGPGTIQASGFGGGHIGPISEAEMAAIMGQRAPAWNAGSPDTRNLGAIPLPPERVPSGAQALPPDQLEALNKRFGRGMSIGLTGAPLNQEAIYPDLLAAARAKNAGQDVTVPTVVGSNRYAGGSAQAKEMQQASWQRARQARDDRAAQQAQRLAGDPVTQYRAARAGNPMAAMQMQLNALGGANSPAALAMLLGPTGAAHVIGQGFDAQGRNAAAQAEAAQLEQFMKQKRDSEIAARVIALVDKGMTPADARAQAEAEYGVPQPVVAAQAPMPVDPNEFQPRTGVGEILKGLKDAIYGFHGWGINAGKDIREGLGI